ncbi:MAG: glycyl-radical enzyme activating protein [Clostridia bacterium]|nr:glycyl-radical enzyme activating protein [Clostridia bacterium]
MDHAKSYDKKNYGYVFNIQHFSVHDGPGIRTIVFLKGCPLRCQWCSNPESHHVTPDLAYNSNKCIGIDECGYCIGACPQKAISNSIEDKKVKINWNLCDNCLKCTDVCPSLALNKYGNLMNVKEVIDAVEADSVFYSRSEGGITLSGGEPLLQIDFAIALLKEAKKRRITTAIETTGHTDWVNLEKACSYLDTVLYDIKCIDGEKHKKYTGITNEIALENFRKMCEAFPEIKKIVRTAVIPGFNDSEEDILEIMSFLKGLPNVEYELLPYHRLGQPKYEYMGRVYPMGNTKLKDEKIQKLNQLVKTYFPKLNKIG